MTSFLVTFWILLVSVRVGPSSDIDEDLFTMQFHGRSGMFGP